MTTIIDLPEGGANITRTLTLTDNNVPIDLDGAVVEAVIEDLGSFTPSVRPQTGDDIGKIEILFKTADMVDPGVYEGYVKATWSDTSNVIFPMQVVVEDIGEPESWATLSEVKKITGKVVSAEHLAIASSIIELYGGRPIGLSDRLSTRSRRLLKVATAWQAKHVSDNPETLGQGAVVSGSQDGVSFTYAQSDTPELHPFAKRALMSLPQYGTRLVPFPYNYSRRMPSFLLEASDDIDGREWHQMRDGM